MNQKDNIEKLEKIKQFLGYIIWDCFHNDIKVDDSACNGVTNYIFNGVGGDNKFFEIWLERFDDIIAQIKKQEREQIKTEIKEIIDRKFPRGERLWCVECAERIYKEIKKLKDK